MRRGIVEWFLVEGSLLDRDSGVDLELEILQRGDLA